MGVPELFSYAKNKLITRKKVLTHEDLTQLFHLPISEIAFEQLQQMTQMLDRLTTTENADVWKYSWGISSTLRGPTNS